MFKKIMSILIIFLMASGISYAYEQFGGVEENIYGYEFQAGDTQRFLNKGRYYLNMYEKATSPAQKSKYLNEAMRYFFLLSKVDKTNINAHIGLGKVYDEMKLDRYAKEHFYHAYNINNKNAELNYKLGDFYFKRKDLYKAQFYLNRGERYGYKSPELNKKLTILYNQLADTEKAKKYYKKTVSNNNPDINRANKIRLLDELNSDDSQYYLFIK